MKISHELNYNDIPGHSMFNLKTDYAGTSIARDKFTGLIEVLFFICSNEKLPSKGIDAVV